MSTPLLLLNRRTLLAMDPITGVARWQVPLEDLPTRFFVTDETVLVATASAIDTDKLPGAIVAFTLAGGVLLGKVQLPFAVTAGLVHEGHLFLAGRRGAACLTARGEVRWIASPDRGQVLPGVTVDGALVARDASGKELWRVDRQDASAEARPGLAIGALVAQPDLK